MTSDQGRAASGSRRQLEPDSCRRRRRPAGTGLWSSAGASCLGAVIFGLVLAASAPAFGASEPSARLRTLSAEAVLIAGQRDPVTAYARGIETGRHDLWPDDSPAALEAFHAREDALRDALSRIDDRRLSAADRDERDRLEAHLQDMAALRVCRRELWDVDHATGWPALLSLAAQRQPVQTPRDRDQALARWRAFPAFVEREIANLERGLAGGWSSPRRIVERVIVQVRTLAEDDAALLRAPAANADDPAFVAAFETVLAQSVAPALERFSVYLQTQYMPRARTTLAVSALPDGADCYTASLASWTTTDLTPADIHGRGLETVAANLETARALAQAEGLTLEAFVDRMRTDPANRFESEAALIADSRAMVARGRAASTAVFESVGTQALSVEPLRAAMRGSGVTSHYENAPNPEDAAVYRVASETWRDETRSAAEITAFHEGYPGHHLQFVLAPDTDSQLSSILNYAAFAEGWGRYAESLAEQLHLYETPYGPVQRRLWPARGMVADPGLHVMGWSREETVEYLLEAGRFSRADTEALVDRMAVMPGQLTAYDTGALEIAALRAEAEAALGERFDLRAFHAAVLDGGPLPLSALRRRLTAWIEAGGPR